MGSAVHIFVAGILAAVVTAACTPLTARFAYALGAVDVPGPRKMHRRPTPRLGGVAVAAGLTVGLGAAALLALFRPDRVVSDGWARDAGLLAAATSCIFLIGLLDDVRRVSAPVKLLVQGLAATLLVTSAGWTFGSIGLPGDRSVDLGLLAVPLTILWIVGICNAINLLDGMDGLATGVAAIISTGLLCYAILLRADMVAVCLAGIAGAASGFLIHNRAPARVFLGDAGALTLGFMLAALSVRASRGAPAEIGFVLPLVLLGLPAIDTALVGITRFVSAPHRGVAARLGRVIRADQTHLHHLLRALLRNDRRVINVFYFATLLASLAAFAVAATRSATLGYGVLMVELLAIAGFRVVAARKLAAMDRRLGRDLAILPTTPRDDAIPHDGRPATSVSLRATVDESDARLRVRQAVSERR